jgi:hypothetical protein
MFNMHETSMKPRLMVHFSPDPKKMQLLLQISQVTLNLTKSIKKIRKL